MTEENLKEEEQYLCNICGSELVPVPGEPCNKCMDKHYDKHYMENDNKQESYQKDTNTDKDSG